MIFSQGSIRFINAFLEGCRNVAVKVVVRRGEGVAAKK